MNRFIKVTAAWALVFSSAAWADDFRSSDWGATEAQVMEQETATSVGREEHEQGGFSLLYTAPMFGQDAEIRYFFDALCGRLVAGSIAFSNPVSDLDYPYIAQTLSNIYGETTQHTNLNGGHYLAWQDGATNIWFLHLPPGVEVPELADRPPTAIYFRLGDGKPTSCEFGE